MIRLKLKFTGLLILIILFIMGCSGNYGKFKRLPESESTITQRELIENWTNYKVYFTGYGYSQALKTSDNPFRATLIVFDPKNDDREILAGKFWATVKNNETWTKIMKENTTSSGIFAVGWDDTMFDSYNSTNTRVQEIWSSDNQLYGIIIRPKSYNTVVPKQVDENTIQLLWQRTGGEYYNE